MASEFYDLSKRAFIESLALVGVPITFGSSEKQCISDRIGDKSQYEIIGYMPQLAVHVQMLDDDIAEWKDAGLTEGQSNVTFQGTVYKLIGFFYDPMDPTVQLNLSNQK